MIRRMAISQIVLALAAGILSVAAPCFAEDVPVITSHSQTEFAIYKGDQLTLEVKAKGEGLESKWGMAHNIFCRALSCDIDTGDWGLGVHKVVFVVFNKKGSLFLKYSVRILAAPAGYKPGKVHPPLVEDDKGIESVGSDDLTVSTVNGRGYSYDKKKLQVVGPVPRVVEWNEKLKTQANSQMRISRDGHEYHVLASGTAVYLSKAESGRRALILKRGTLRSRNLKAKDPRWSVVVGDWLQVDTDALGDVLVTRVAIKGEDDEDDEPESKLAPEKVRVVVLRGNARVYQGKSAHEGKGFVVGQGLEVVMIKGDDSPPVLVQPDPKRMAKLIGETTPLYLLGQRPLEEGRSLTLLQDQKMKSLENGIEVARTANGQRDFFVTIEALAPFAAEIRNSYEAQLLLGEAYRGIYLYEPALKSLNVAAAVNPDAPEPRFAMGLIELHGKNWQKAVEHFEAADSLGYPDSQQLNYYLGVTHFNAKDPVAAKSSFTYSLWDPEQPDVAASAQKFYDRLDDDGWLDVNFDAGVGYDSNVLRASDKVDLATLAEGAITKKKSLTYEAGAGFSLWPARGESVKLQVSFDAKKNGYQEKALARLALFQETLGLGLRLGFGGEPHQPRWFMVETKGFARMIFLGDQRAMDEVGGSVGIGSPALIGLMLRAESLLAQDPLPVRDDLLDPIRWELVAAGDRSAHVHYLGLSLIPLDGPTFHLGLDLKSGGAIYSNALHVDENFKDVALRLDLGLATSLRNSFGLDLGQTKRTFTAWDGGRKDTNTAISLGWKYFYTTSLYHRVGLTSESQTSTSELNGYKRQTFGYQLNLDF